VHERKSRWPHGTFPHTSPICARPPRKHVRRPPTRSVRDATRSKDAPRRNKHTTQAGDIERPKRSVANAARVECERSANTRGSIFSIRFAQFAALSCGDPVGPAHPALAQDGKEGVDFLASRRCVANGDNASSRAYPAGGRQKVSQIPCNPRSEGGRMACSYRKSPPIPAQRRTTKPGLSRPKSRLRVPSLPSLEEPANRHVLLPARRRSRISSRTGIAPGRRP
jgi:hypothetical protein